MSVGLFGWRATAGDHGGSCTVRRPARTFAGTGWWPELSGPATIGAG
ncbi:hypothetical protein [Arthrobacter sulfonylureivorans]|uniref:Uncharacterized protein n=1 Tax=Arthrobacter sulfonylureivorans TaxID=2486855 RepID=A0ABY3WEG3_9MICC|nr:hypothetical protein [Arthrobacter sulfonylureivorans]UNK47812.1 hypothetical protein MNQ99_18220 [Arthrobacter sulfonylureivorans]